jgi:hypothetical protein
MEDARLHPWAAHVLHKRVRMRPRAPDFGPTVTRDNPCRRGGGGPSVVATCSTWKGCLKRLVAEGSSGSYAMTAKSCQVPGTPFSVCSP